MQREADDDEHEGTDGVALGEAEQVAAVEHEVAARTRHLRAGALQRGGVEMLAVG